MLTLLISCYSQGIFSSRLIERATHRDVAVRFVAANLHPDHDTIAAFRAADKTAFEAAFLQVSLVAREAGLLRLGTVSIDGIKINANASKIRLVRDDRAKELRAKLASDIAALTARAEAADAETTDPQSLPDELARRETLLGKLDAACARLEADARAEARASRTAYAAKKSAYDARKGRRGRQLKPPDDEPPPERQSNLTDPDSALMRRSDAHEYRQAYNAQAVVCAEGSQLILATNLVASPGDAPRFAPHGSRHAGHHRSTHDGARRHRLSSGRAVADLRAHGVYPLVATGRIQSHRPYDFRPPQEPRARRRLLEPWKIAVKAMLETDDAKALYRRRKQTVEPVFGIIKSAMGFLRFHLRGQNRVAAEWTLIALAYYCRR